MTNSGVENHYDTFQLGRVHQTSSSYFACVDGKPAGTCKFPNLFNNISYSNILQ